MLLGSDVQPELLLLLTPLSYSSREAKNVLEVAGELGLTGKDYIWIMSSFCIGVLRNPNAPRVYPLGSLGRLMKDF